MSVYPADSGFSIDETDMEILRAITNNGRTPIAQLADTVGITETPCGRRLRQLETIGAIRGYVADIDPEAVNLCVAAFVFIKLKGDFDRSFDAFAQAISEIDAVQSCHFVAGEMDFILFIRLAHIRQLEDFSREKIGRLDMIDSFHTTVSVREVHGKKALKF